MVNQSTFESATLALLAHLKEKKQAIQARHAQELAEIDREIDAVSTTARLLREAKKAAPIIEATAIPPNLHGKSTREACIEIAKLNNGMVRVGEARDAIVAAGILSSESKNTWGIVYTTMSRADEFEKAGTGAFRLISGDQPQEQRLLQ
jgi:hypothetical protein